MPMKSVIELLDALEALVVRSSTLPLTDKKVVAETEILGVLSQIRTALPRELVEAQRLRLEAERLHRVAQDHARQIVLDAEETARRLVEESNVLKEVERRGQDLLAVTQKDARSIRTGAEAYANQVLSELEERVLRVLEAIRKGRALLKADKE